MIQQKLLFLDQNRVLSAGGFGDQIKRVFKKVAFGIGLDPERYEKEPDKRKQKCTIMTFGSSAVGVHTEFGILVHKLFFLKCSRPPSMTCQLVGKKKLGYVKKRK